EGMPNLYCGVLCVVLIGMFLRATQIRLREKIGAVLVLGFLLLSCNWNILNFIWHGFHFPNMLPYRFSFLVSFVLITVAYRAYILILEQKMKWLDLLAMTLWSVLFLVLVYQKDRKQAVIYTAITVAAYLLLLLLKRFRLLNRRVFASGMMLVMLVEMGCHVQMSTEAVSTSDYVTYPEKYKEVEALLQQLEKEDDTFYRTELTSWYTLNDPALYRYQGVSQFSSMANCNVTTFLKKLGLPASEAGNRYYYAHSSPYLDMLLGIRYVIQKNGTMAETETVEQVATSNGVSSYRNRYALPIGFLVEKETADFTVDTNKNPFEVQNDLFAKMTGITEPLYTAVDVTDVGHTGLDVSRNGYGYYTYFPLTNATETYLKYNFVPEQDAILYGYLSLDSAEEVDIYQNERYDFSQKLAKQPYIFSMGSYQAGERATLKCNVSRKSIQSNVVTVYVYALNKNVLEQGYEMLSASGLQLTDWSDTHLIGTLEAPQDGICYLSVPIDEGWYITVDGVETEPIAIGDAMTGISISSGMHTISMRYCPKGFAAGAILCGSAVLWITFCYVMEQKQKYAGGFIRAGRRRRKCEL
ncbi:MAG: YfhO family protein, partial [Oscillospiraceae bacterium]|nr:YfhO family protein [Oscillospiraceae bacterium]